MILNILGLENKTTKTGKPYTRFNTSQGWMSCFDTATIDAVSAYEGKSVDVEISESGDFKNIKKFIRAVGESETPVVEEQQLPRAITNQLPKANGQSAMYVSYAKDLFIAMIESDKRLGENTNIDDKTMKVAMDFCCELVNSARAKFS